MKHAPFRLPGAKTNIRFNHSAELPQIHFAIRLPSLRMISRVTKSLVEPKRVIASVLPCKLLGTLNIRLDPRAHAGPAGVTADGDHRCSFDESPPPPRCLRPKPHEHCRRPTPELHVAPELIETRSTLSPLRSNAPISLAIQTPAMLGLMEA